MGHMPLRRPGFPDDLAKAVLFMASDLVRRNTSRRARVALVILPSLLIDTST
jgi:hypothetical protein